MWSFRTSLLSMFAAVVLFALSGCAPRIHVVSQVNPSPMKKSSTFDVEPLTFENFQVGGKIDSDYSKSLKKDTTAAAWEDDKIYSSLDLSQALERPHSNGANPWDVSLEQRSGNASGV
jgi:hypothetical protein